MKKTVANNFKVYVCIQLLTVMVLFSCNHIEALAGHQFHIVINDNDTSCISEINKKKYDDGFFKAAKGDTVIMCIKCEIERVIFDGLKDEYKQIGNRIEFPMPGNDVTITLVKTQGNRDTEEIDLEYSLNGDTLLRVSKTRAGELNVKEGTVVIGSGAFLDQRSIDKVVLPNSIRKIDYKAFAGCGLRTIEMPEKGLEEIEDLAFWDCKNLVKITIPKTVKNIGLNPFMGASSIKIESLSNDFDTEANCLIDNSKETIICYYGKESTVNLTRTSCLIKTIGAYAFYNCKSIQEINLPIELSTIGTNAFKGCDSIKKVTCTGNCNDIKIETGNENITKFF